MSVKVYVLGKGCIYEGGSVIGVFSSVEKAREVVENRLNDFREDDPIFSDPWIEEEPNRWLRNEMDFISIKEWEIDVPNSFWLKNETL